MRSARAGCPTLALPLAATSQSCSNAELRKEERICEALQLAYHDTPQDIIAAEFLVATGQFPVLGIHHCQNWPPWHSFPMHEEGGLAVSQGYQVSDTPGVWDNCGVSTP